MEKTYHYQITHDGAVLATGEQTLDTGFRQLHETRLWLDVLRDLAKKANLAIKVGEDWYHPDDSNFSPFEDEEEVIDVQVTYGVASPQGSLNQQYKAMKI
ncbi:hypothetical protein [Ectopseudomonas guguanensis]|jgi:hypothetical protein|uniref:Uncharacterized protein n=1 Tax=Tilletia caries TaxID=13290 RepID=A0A177U5J2_9BASI|nr:MULTISPECIES: hypothetical protein [Pseudomonas]KAE8256835.1 hypothetical protein A4X03_0g5009 [Tilletia caries]MPT18047.1 hypothetical protein [Pseudomonas sp.]WJH56081.1 hypothetical protein FE254_07835 [Pseudomonas guguanensis]